MMFRNSLLRKPPYVWVVIIFVLAVGIVISMIFRPLSAATAVLVPSSTISNGWPAGSSGCTSTISGHTCIDQGRGSIVTTSYIGTGTGGADTAASFSMSDQPFIQSATQLSVEVLAWSAVLGSDADSITVNVSVDGTQLPSTTNEIFMTDTPRRSYVTYTGNWTQQQMNTMTISFTRNALGKGSQSAKTDDVRIANTNVEMTYTASTSISQAAYRWFANTDSATPGMALASQNQSVSNFRDGKARLQMLVDQSGTSAQASDSYKLQYATRGTDGVCHAASSSNDELYMDFQTPTTSSLTTMAGSGSNDTSVGSNTWSSSANITEVDGVNARNSIISGSQFQETNYLVSAAHGLAVPADANIEGIEVRIKGTSGGYKYAQDRGVKLKKSGVFTATSRTAASGTVWDTDIVRQYGGSQDLWGTTWTPGEVNSADFGAAIYFGLDRGPTDAWVDVDYIEVQVYYSQVVNPSSGIHYFSNPAVADGATAVNGGMASARTIKPQSYEERSPANVRSSSLALAGETALWDFSLDFRYASKGNYCFRMVKADGSMLTTYGVIASIGITTSTEQSSYRVYTNADSSTPGSPLANQNTPANVVPGSSFRLRQLLHQTSGSSGAGQSYVLQAGEKATSCSAAAYETLSGPVNASIASTGKAMAASNSEGWTNSQYVRNDDNLTASYIFPSTEKNGVITYLDFSPLLHVSNFGFSIPSTAIVTGIEYYLDVGSSSNVIDERVYLTKSGTTMAGNNLARSSTLMSRTYGSSSELWGTTWTPAEINSSEFGLALDVGLVDNTVRPSVEVDSLTVNVHYTIPSSQGDFYNNTSVSDDITIAAGDSDPAATSGAVRLQTYSEDQLITVANTIATGENGLWDFSLKFSEDLAGKTYCFRIINSDGSPLASYAHYPEVTFASAPTGPTLPQQLRGGQSVVNGIKNPFTW